MRGMPGTRQDERGRVDQKNRTRDAIIRAAGDLLGAGGVPTIPDAASEARVSQATAYRYFPTQDSLLAAVVEREMRSAIRVLEGRLAPSGDAEEDLTRLADAIFEEILLREPAHRSLLHLALERWFAEGDGHGRQRVGDRGGRIAFVAQALEPLRP